MNSFKAVVLALSALLFITASWQLLPRIQHPETLPKGAAPTERVYPLELIPAAQFVSLISDTMVSKGDTIGIQFVDSTAAIRLALRELAKVGDIRNFKSEAEEFISRYQNLLPVPIALGLKTILNSISEEKLEAEPVPQARRATPAKDHALLKAEIMGAEDATTDYLKQFQALDPPENEDEAVELERLKALIQSKQSFLRDAKRKLDRESPATSGNPNLPARTPSPELTAEQRQRIYALSQELQPDSSFVISPATGLYRRVSNTDPGYILEKGATEAQVIPGSAYGLEPRGLPALWAIARRIELQQGNFEPNPSILLVVEDREVRF